MIELQPSSGCDTESPSDSFADELIECLKKAADGGLSPAGAMELLARLMAQVPGASKETMDKIKTMDKLINTARAMMETKLKNDEVDEIMRRIDELEARVSDHGNATVDEQESPVELWERRGNDRTPRS